VTRYYTAALLPTAQTFSTWCALQACYCMNRIMVFPEVTPPKRLSRQERLHTGCCNAGRKQSDITLLLCFDCRRLSIYLSIYLCAVLPNPCLRWFRLALRPVCGFGVFVLASLCVAWLCFVACVCDCTQFCFQLAGLFFRLSLHKLYLSMYASPAFLYRTCTRSTTTRLITTRTPPSTSPTRTTSASPRLSPTTLPTTRPLPSSRSSILPSSRTVGGSRSRQ
jgi:hypothetical protein